MKVHELIAELAEQEDQHAEVLFEIVENDRNLKKHGGIFGSLMGDEVLCIDQSGVRTVTISFQQMDLP